MNDLNQEYKKIGGSLLLKGYGLQRKDGSLAICTQVYSGSAINESLGIITWNYDMFEDGEFKRISGDDVHYELQNGGKIIVVQI